MVSNEISVYIFHLLLFSRHMYEGTHIPSSLKAVEWKSKDLEISLTTNFVRSYILQINTASRFRFFVFRNIRYGHEIRSSCLLAYLATLFDCVMLCSCNWYYNLWMLNTRGWRRTRSWPVGTIPTYFGRTATYFTNPQGWDLSPDFQSSIDNHSNSVKGYNYVQYSVLFSAVCKWWRWRITYT
jgi:hypothetical protein